MTETSQLVQELWHFVDVLPVGQAFLCTILFISPSYLAMNILLQAVMEGYVPGAGDGTAGRPLGVGGGASSCSLSGRAATIRPLTAAYQASSGPNQV